jgi:hypothetical protein
MDHKSDSFRIPRPVWECSPLNTQGRPMSPMSPYLEVDKPTAEGFQVRLKTLI